MANEMRMPCSLMEGAPGYNTVGWVGQLMMDTASADGDVYKCVRIDGGQYVWIKIASGDINTGQFATKKELNQLSEQIADKVTTPNTAEVGQVIAVKAVDENGKPTEWEAVDMASGGTSVQSDWNQTDEAAADFIKNKPFGDEVVEIVPPGNTEPMEDADGFVFLFETNVSIDDGNIVDVIWDGTKYSSKAQFFEGLGTVFGNLVVIGGGDTGEPFTGIVQEGIISLLDITATESVTREISVSKITKTTISTDYLPYAMTTFYINNLLGGYIYSDPNCTTKVNHMEARDALKKSVVSLYEAVEINRFTPVYTSNEAGAKVFFVNMGENTYKYYTTEYTE